MSGAFSIGTRLVRPAELRQRRAAHTAEAVGALAGAKALRRPSCDVLRCGRGLHHGDFDIGRQGHEGLRLGARALATARRNKTRVGQSELWTSFRQIRAPSFPVWCVEVLAVWRVQVSSRFRELRAEARFEREAYSAVGVHLLDTSLSATKSTTSSPPPTRPPPTPPLPLRLPRLPLLPLVAEAAAAAVVVASGCDAKGVAASLAPSTWDQRKS